jgi:hypothetical protein
MKLIYLTQTQVNKLYTSLAIAESINKIVFKGSDEGYTFFMRRIATEVKGLLEPLVKQEAFFDDLFKCELQYCLNQCLLDKKLVSDYGAMWFANKTIMLEIFELMENEMNN